MANPTIIGKQAVWGTGDVSGTYASAIVVSASAKKTSEKDYVYDDNGFTTGVIFYDTKTESTLELICESGTTAPAVGTSVTMADGSACYVNDCELKWEQKGWKKLSVNATYYTNLT